MIDPTTGLEIDLAQPQAVPMMVPPVARYPMLPPAPDVVAPGDLVTAKTPLNVPALFSDPSHPMPAIPNIGPAPANTPIVAPPPAAAAAAPAPAQPGAPPIAMAPEPPALPPAGPAPIRGPGGMPRLPSRDTRLIDAAYQSEEDAIREQGAASRAGADAEAAAIAEGRQRKQAAAEQVAQLQQHARDAVRAINQRTQDAYDEARNTTIPDFWAGREGAHVGAAILAGIGSGAQALTAFGTGVNVGNNALQIIERNVERYYTQQRDRINDLFKYAAARQQLGQQEIHEWAQQLNDLQYQIAATYADISDHVQEVNAASRGRSDQARANTLIAQTREKSLAAQDAAQKATFEMMLQKAQLGVAQYNATTARMGEENQAEARKAAAAKAGAPTESQSKDAMFANEAQIALNTLRETGIPSPEVITKFNNQKQRLGAASESKGVIGAVATAAGKAIGFIPEGAYEGIDARDQKSLQAMQALVEGIARRHSGGAIAKEEDYRFAQNYIPQPGDSNELIQTKLGNAQKYLQQSVQNLGPAAASVTPPVGGQRPASLTLNGRIYQLQPDGSYL
ncbi:MAG TPA: hypothetical protein VLZ78_02620 [Terrimesophilobacter sp.]|nr:hypothetical protein [Terrimesophilobacter sp.]